MVLLEDTESDSSDYDVFDYKNIEFIAVCPRSDIYVFVIAFISHLLSIIMIVVLHIFNIYSFMYFVIGLFPR